jgi:hypothetical protein
MLKFETGLGSGCFPLCIRGLKRVGFQDAERGSVRWPCRPRIWKQGRESQFVPGKLVSIQDLFPRFPCMRRYDLRGAWESAHRRDAAERSGFAASEGAVRIRKQSRAIW